jgi:hypothetical protein
VDGLPGVCGQFAWGVLVADGLRCLHGRSVIEVAVLEVRGLFSDGPPQPRGIRLGLVDGPPGACGWSV